MTPAEAAAKLDGNEYGKEGSDELFAEMKGAGLVAVFGASDDLIEMRGAIDDEGGAYGGATAHVTPAGLVQNECENDACPHFIVAKRNAAKIKAIWDDGGFSWRYRTDIPHAETCGFRSSTPPRWERCHSCGAQSENFGEFCHCGAQGFSHICSNCDADVVVNHPDTVRP